jgi:hypothetical protein
VNDVRELDSTGAGSPQVRLPDSGVRLLLVLLAVALRAAVCVTAIGTATRRDRAKPILFRMAKPILF